MPTAARTCRQSHKDSVRCTAVEEQPEAKEVQLSQPSSTSLLMISSGLTSVRVRQLHLPPLDLARVSARRLHVKCLRSLAVAVESGSGRD